MKSWSHGYTGCGLSGFYKKGEQRQENFKFQNNFSVKARAFFKNVKIQKDLIQPIRDYTNLVHEDYMKMLQLMVLRKKFRFQIMEFLSQIYLVMILR